MWWINFRRGSEVIGVAIIEASSIFHARTRLAVCGIGRPVDYSDGKEVDARCAALEAKKPPFLFAMRCHCGIAGICPQDRTRWLNVM
jgi:hypothetical protein